MKLSTLSSIAQFPALTIKPHTSNGQFFPARVWPGLEYTWLSTSTEYADIPIMTQAVPTKTTSTKLGWMQGRKTLREYETIVEEEVITTTIRRLITKEISTTLSTLKDLPPGWLGVICDNEGNTLELEVETFGTMGETVEIEEAEPTETATWGWVDGVSTAASTPTMVSAKDHAVQTVSDVATPGSFVLTGIAGPVETGIREPEDMDEEVIESQWVDIVPPLTTVTSSIAEDTERLDQETSDDPEWEEMPDSEHFEDVHLPSISTPDVGPPVETELWVNEVEHPSNADESWTTTEESSTTEPEVEGWDPEETWEDEVEEMDPSANPETPLSDEYEDTPQANPTAASEAPPGKMAANEDENDDINPPSESQDNFNRESPNPTEPDFDPSDTEEEEPPIVVIVTETHEIPPDDISTEEQSPEEPYTPTNDESSGEQPSTTAEQSPASTSDVSTWDLTRWRDYLVELRNHAGPLLSLFGGKKDGNAWGKDGEQRT